MKKLSKLLALLLALTFLLTACGSKGNEGNGEGEGEGEGEVVLTDQEKRLVEDKHLIVGLGAEGDGLDPGASGDSISQMVIPHLYEGLFDFSSDGALRNVLCESYTVSDDLKVYDFKLREDAYWMDGKQVTMHDVYYGMLRPLNVELNSGYVKFLFYIVGAEEVYLDPTISKDTIGIEVIDDFNMRITLKEPCAFFPQLVARSTMWPLREDFAPPTDVTWAKDPKKAVANGPYYLSEYVANGHVVLLKNPNYRDADKVYFEKITFFYMADPQAQVNAYRTGQIDIATQTPTDIRANPEFASSTELHDVPIIVNYYVTIDQNGGIPALNDPRVRKAMNYAIDRELLCDILNGTETPLYGLVPPGIVNPATGKDFREEGGNLAKYDLEEAKRLLAEAGYPDGAGFPKLTYIYNSNQRHDDTATALKDMWKKLGIDVDLAVRDWSIFLEERAWKGKFEIARHAMSADYSDPTTYLGMYNSTSTQNEAHVNNPEYDRYYNLASNETDIATRMNYLHEAEKVLIQEESYLIPLFSYGYLHLIKDGVAGYESDPSGSVNYAFSTFSK
ncbi:MAG: peptide ABC transporter substrate-binding protein [Clostridiales bacterium]|nr:peptide ABC transporter substrate-binding protein [Clostridiales bacterium]